MPKLNLQTAQRIKGSSWQATKLKGQGFGWTGPTVFDASGLTLSSSFVGPAVIPTYFGETFTESMQPLVLVARQVKFPTSFVDCCLMEMGGTAGGVNVGISAYLLSSGDFTIRGGNGFQLLGHADVVHVTTSAPTGTWDVAMEFDVTGYALKLWFGTNLVASTSKTLAPDYMRWARDDDGGYLQTDGGTLPNHRQEGTPSAPWPESAGDLEVYFNQTVT